MTLTWHQHLWLVLLLLPALGFLLHWVRRESLHPMSPQRQQLLFIFRLSCIALLFLALTRPALRWPSREAGQRAVVFLFDHSLSLGPEGLARAVEQADAFAGALPRETRVGYVSTGAGATALSPLGEPVAGTVLLESLEPLMEADGRQSDLERGIRLAANLFPAGASARILYLGDGIETRGRAEIAAREAALAGIQLDAVPVAGPVLSDVRVRAFRTNRTRLNEGATLELTAEVESSLDGEGTVSLFENGIEIASQPYQAHKGETKELRFTRNPAEGSFFRYELQLSGFAGDAIAGNNASDAVVTVEGRPLFLFIEGDPAQKDLLPSAMAGEGILLDSRPPEAFPLSLAELASYDGLILSDVPAYRFSPYKLSLMQDYVRDLGGGLVMIGGVNSFGAGGYYRTAMEEILPVKIQNPDREEKQSVALFVVLDRSGSMRAPAGNGTKMDLANQGALQALEVLKPQDRYCLYVTDSAPYEVIPMGPVAEALNRQDEILATTAGGGGIFVFVSLLKALEVMRETTAKVKHVILFADAADAEQPELNGRTAYELVDAMRAEGITLSTVALGQETDPDRAFVQQLAERGGGSFYLTSDPLTLPQIFTQDTMTQTQRNVREVTFKPQLNERDPMVQGWDPGVPSLLGYVRTSRREDSVVPLVTDQNEPLLAHWRYGLGRVTAFTSDCKPRWATLWLSQDRDGYGRFWSQVLRETARASAEWKMDLQIRDEGAISHIAVDLLESAEAYRDSAEVVADVYFLPAGSVGSQTDPIVTLTLNQTGPGRYEGAFRPRENGAYIVRARHGTDLVSSGFVRNLAGESATGEIDNARLETLTGLTGGDLLESPAELAPPRPALVQRIRELRPWLLLAALAAFLGDVTVRRWENLLALVEFVRHR